MNYLKNCKVLIAMIAFASLTVVSCSDEIDEIPTDETTSENLTEKKIVEINYEEPTTYFYNGKEYSATEWAAQQQIFKINKEPLFQIVLGEKVLAYDTEEKAQAVLETLRNMTQQSVSKNVSNDKLSISSDEWASNDYENLYNAITRGTPYFTAKRINIAKANLFFYAARNRSTSEGYLVYYLNRDLGNDGTYIVRYTFPTSMRRKTSSIFYDYVQAAVTSRFSSDYPLSVRMRENTDFSGRAYTKILQDEGDTFTQNNLSQNGWFGQNWEDRTQSIEICVGCTQGNSFFN